MEFNTLSNTHLIINIEERNNVLLTPHLFFSFIFNLDDEEKVSEVFSFIFSEENKLPFTVTLKGKKQNYNNLDWLDKLCLILCHYNYFKHHRRLLLGVQLEAHPPGKTFFKFLSDQLKAQGFKDIILVDFGATNIETIDSSILLFKNTKPSEFNNWYFTHLAKSSSTLNIFLNSEGVEPVKEFFKLKLGFENNLRIKQPEVYQIIKKLQQSSFELSECKSSLRTLKEDISSKQTYVDFLLGKYKEGKDESMDLNEIMKLKKYYHNEYEILPTWYKRFGHIIKVIMGKRTFRSLFNDNVKKYKD
jgi:hypothetical protein